MSQTLLLTHCQNRPVLQHAQSHQFTALGSLQPLHIMHISITYCLNIHIRATEQSPAKGRRSGTNTAFLPHVHYTSTSDHEAWGTAGRTRCYCTLARGVYHQTSNNKAPPLSGSTVSQLHHLLQELQRKQKAAWASCRSAGYLKVSIPCYRQRRAHWEQHAKQSSTNMM